MHGPVTYDCMPECTPLMDTVPEDGAVIVPARLVERRLPHVEAEEKVAPVTSRTYWYWPGSVAVSVSPGETVPPHVLPEKAAEDEEACTARPIMTWPAERQRGVSKTAWREQDSVA